MTDLITFSNLKNDAQLKRLTPQRLAIYEYLKNTKDHPTAAEIFAELKPRFSSLSLATVYNTLEVLVERGMISALGTIDGKQTHFDGDPSPHINLVCSSCAKVLDLPLEDADQTNQLIAKTGFDIKGSRIVYYGVCPDCQNQTQSQHKELN